ncbi:MAG: tol-pal system protein YbgF [Rubrivivax sp.]
MHRLTPPRAARQALARWPVLLLLGAALAGPWGGARAGLFDDEEARKAILDLRERISQSDQGQQQRLREQNTQLTEQITTLRRSLLDLNASIEQMRAEMATLRGQHEQSLKDVSELQRLQKDMAVAVEDRLRRLEPQKVALDGREFAAVPQEKLAYDEALATLRRGDFDGASAQMQTFLTRYPNSGFAPATRFWLGNAQYGKRDYKSAIVTFRSLVTESPNDPKAPEALLALANSQAEMKDAKAARKTLEELLKNYPQSEAASAGKDRLAALK